MMRMLYQRKNLVPVCIAVPVAYVLLKPVAYAGFFNGGGLVTSHCNDVKILHNNYSSLEILKCIVL